MNEGPGDGVGVAICDSSVIGVFPNGKMGDGAHLYGPGWKGDAQGLRRGGGRVAESGMR